MVKTSASPGRRNAVNFNFLLAGLFLILLAGPVCEDIAGWNNPLIMRVIFSCASLLFVISLTRDLRFFLLELVPALFTLVFALISVVTGAEVFYHLMLGSAFVFFILATRYAAREVFLSGPVDLNKIIGSVCIYLLLVVAWAILYEFLELAIPGSFSGLPVTARDSRFDEFAYFSLVTITTLGYGDISPDNLISGVAAGVEALVGVFYIAVLVASLVGDFMSRRNQFGGSQ